MKDAWFLASNRTDLSAAKALQLYGQRWGIETSFRDIKDYKFGMGMGDVHISNPVRRDRLFLFSALAIVLLTLLGKAGDSVGLENDQGQYQQEPNLFVLSARGHLLPVAA